MGPAQHGKFFIARVISGAAGVAPLRAAGKASREVPARQRTPWFPASVIASAMGVTARTIKLRGAREGWPARWRKSAWLFVPPRCAVSRCRELASKIRPNGFRRVIFGDPVRAELIRIRWRLDALLELERMVDEGVPAEVALGITTKIFTLHCSRTALWRWRSNFAALSVAGLCERRRGNQKEAT